MDKNKKGNTDIPYKDIEKRRQYDKKRNQSSVRRAWITKNKERLSKIARKWNKSSKGIAWRIKNQSKTNERHRLYSFTSRGKYLKYKQNSKKRNIEFKLTFNEFIKFWKKDCTYCKSKIITIGIDRIDNNLGYIKGNVQSCCSLCNGMKSNFSEEEFLDQCLKIILNIK